jgi:RimJ/RimL family protein N-acetyltransferase
MQSACGRVGQIASSERTPHGVVHECAACDVAGGLGQAASLTGKDAMTTESGQAAARPVGTLVDPLPSGRTPGRVPLVGAEVRLEPVDAGAHAESLFRLSHGRPEDAVLWTYLAYGPFADPAAFERWLEERARSQDPLFFAIVDLAGGEAAGMASYMNVVPANGSIEIGHIWFAPALQKSRAATEAIYLLARHAFEELRYRRLEWKCDALNAASIRAARRFGFTYEGTFRQHMVVKGRNRDTAWFALLDRDWPAQRAAFERWLAPENFDSDGRQRVALSALTSAR